MLSRCCIFHAQDSELILGMKFTACRKLSWCAGRLQYSAHYRYPQSFPQSVAAVIACSHYHSPIVKYGTVEKSNLAKCRQDDLCCRRTIRRWNPEARSFRLMYGTPAADENFFIHAPVSTKRTVGSFLLGTYFRIRIVAFFGRILAFSRTLCLTGGQRCGRRRHSPCASDPGEGGRATSPLSLIHI